MMWSVHGMNPRVASDRAMIADRIRDADDAGRERPPRCRAISIIKSDSQGMGRIGRVDPPHVQLAHQMKLVHGERATHDNGRILRYLASTRSTRRVPTASIAGSGPSSPGKIADIVLWRRNSSASSRSS